MVLDLAQWKEWYSPSVRAQVLRDFSTYSHQTFDPQILRFVSDTTTNRMEYAPRVSLLDAMQRAHGLGVVVGVNISLAKLEEKLGCQAPTTFSCTLESGESVSLPILYVQNHGPFGSL